MKLRGSSSGSAFIRASAFENLAMYSSSAKWTAGRTLTVVGGGGSLKSMIFVDFGGQQLMGFAPEGSSAGPHLVTSGGEIGEAVAGGFPARVAAP